MNDPSVTVAVARQTSHRCQPGPARWRITTSYRQSLLNSEHRATAVCADCDTELTFTNREPTILGRLANAIIFRNRAHQEAAPA